jgi:hypothetical protein
MDYHYVRLKKQNREVIDMLLVEMAGQREP